MNLTHLFNKPSSFIYIIFMLSSTNTYQLLSFIINLKHSFTPYWKHKQWLKRPLQLKKYNYDVVQRNIPLCYNISVYQTNKQYNKTLFVTISGSNCNRFKLTLNFSDSRPLLQVTYSLLYYIQFYHMNFNSAALLFILNFQKLQFYNLQSTIKKTTNLFTSKNEYFISPILLNNIKNI